MVIDENEKWFSGGEARTDDEREFLDQLRRDAASWTNDVKPADTQAFAWESGPLIVGVDIPKLTTALRHLWVSYWLVEPDQRALEGAWGDDLIADRYTGDRVEDLTVTGVEAKPAQFATWCSMWLYSQLKRPVVREEWGPRKAEIWKLADTNMKLQVKGVWWKRLGPPTKVHRER